MGRIIKSLAGTVSGECFEYEEIISPNHNPRFWNGKLVKPSMIVIHTAQCGEVSSAPENLGDWDAGASRPQASWNFAIGNGSVSCSVPIELLAWHAGPVNAYSIGIEHAGKAEQTPEQWADEYSTAELNLSVLVCVVLCELLQIPVRLIEANELRENHHAGKQSWGICGHHTVTQALSGTHTDPGPNFPWDDYMARIKARALGAPNWPLGS